MIKRFLTPQRRLSLWVWRERNAPVIAIVIVCLLFALVGAVALNAMMHSASASKSLGCRQATVTYVGNLWGETGPILQISVETESGEAFVVRGNPSYSFVRGQTVMLHIQTNGETETARLVSFDACDASK